MVLSSVTVCRTAEVLLYPVLRTTYDIRWGALSRARASSSTAGKGS